LRVAKQLQAQRAFYRTVLFHPTVTSLVAVSIVWKIIFNQQSGLATTCCT
jgi:ABC-type sugar transport system permease subunit